MYKQMTDLETPNEAFIRRWLDVWNETDNQTVPESKLNDLFDKSRNGEVGIEIERVRMLNSVYKTRLSNEEMKTISKEIQQNKNFSGWINSVDTQAVEFIANIEGDSRKRHNYSFATKYCSMSNKDGFPIFDDYICRLLILYQKQYFYYKGGEKLTCKTLRNYEKYKRVYDAFITFFGLKNFGYKEIDQALWGYGKIYFNKQNL